MQKRWYIAKVEYPKTFGFESHHWSRGRNAALHFQGIRQPFPASPRVVATSKQKVTDNVLQCITYRFPRQQRNQSAPKSSNFCSQSQDSRGVADLGQWVRTGEELFRWRSQWWTVFAWKDKKRQRCKRDNEWQWSSHH